MIFKKYGSIGKPGKESLRAKRGNLCSISVQSHVKKLIVNSSAAVFVLLCTSISAQQRLEMKGSAIIGNRELPKILYILPWKSAEPVTLQTPPFSSVLDEVLQPVERSTFKRQLNFYNEIYPASENKL